MVVQPRYIVTCAWNNPSVNWVLGSDGNTVAASRLHQRVDEIPVEKWKIVEGILG